MRAAVEAERLAKKRRADWMASLAVGDEVFTGYLHRDTGDITRVVRMTPTQLVLATGERARRKDGYMIGASNFAMIQEPTQEIRERLIERAEVKRLYRLVSSKHPSLTPERVRAMLAAYDSIHDERPAATE